MLVPAEVELEMEMSWTKLLESHYIALKWLEEINMRNIRMGLVTGEKEGWFPLTEARWRCTEGG